jgi:protein TonB
MKKLFITISFVLIGVFSAIAQTNEPVYEQVDIMPEYQGGMTEITSFIGKNLKYPEQAVKANVIGKVIVKIIIEKDGSVNSVSFLKGIGFGCDEEVERIVKLMPKWKAGIKDGKNVRTFFVLPVMFALENTKKSK